ncbi:SigB/SigF/SigG family RNA polymerase sigma factor [Dactylosporangium sp. NPDC005555]|uniref:SigB/SigF/SigG family RNA polymerase sigma factor n=1 Tax=Dactylosporangium sp. NPDC005555 TaxID=3154889 RepID=UPI0033B126D1
MDLTITLSSRQDEDLMEVSGALDHATVRHLREVLFGLLDAGRCRITVEMSGLRILDAASIRVLLWLRDRAGQAGGDLRLWGATGTVLTALEITGVAKQFHAYDQVSWPQSQRDRQVVDLGSMRVGHDQWPAQVDDLLDRLHTMRAGGPGRDRVRDTIIELCLPAAHRLARRYAGRGEIKEELTQVASLALVKAVDGFDVTRGVEFGAYATPTILGELRRYFRDQSAGIRMPRRLQELRLAAGHAHELLTQRLGRSPTTADVAGHLDVGEDEIVEMLSASSAHRPLSLNAPGPGSDHDNATLMDVVGGDDPAFGLVEYRRSIEVIMAGVSERAQRIISLRFYGNLTQAEIAREVGLSQMHVARLLQQTLSLLRRRLTE